MMRKLSKEVAEAANDLYADRDAKLIHDNVMHKQRRHALFRSVADTFRFMAGITLAAGMAIIGSSLKAVGSVGEAVAAVGAEPVGLTFVAVAATATAVAVGANYVASNLYASASYDSLEINAKHTAQYLSKQMNKDAGQDTSKAVESAAEEPEAKRSDGKTWQQYIANRSQVEQEQGRA